MKRTLLTLAAVAAIALAGASNALATQPQYGGLDQLPCTDGAHWVVVHLDETIPTLVVNGTEAIFIKVTGDTAHFETGPVGSDPDISIDLTGDERLNLSHCLGGEASTQPSDSPSEQPSATPSADPTPSPTGTPSPSVEPSASPTPGVSVAPSSAPSRTPRLGSMPPTDMLTLTDSPMSNAGIAFVLLGAFLITVGVVGSAPQRRR